MEARERDVELLRHVGITFAADRAKIVMDRPLLGAADMMLEWDGWDSIHVRTDAGAEALENTAAAMPFLHRLAVTYSLCSGATPMQEELAEAVAAVLQQYPVEELNINMESATEAAVEIVAEATAVWLARPCATSLKLYTNATGWEETLGRALAAAKSLRKLRLHGWGFPMRVSPLVQALEGLSCLEILRITSWDGAEEEDLCIRLAHMPALRSFTMLLANDSTRVSMEVDAHSLPALKILFAENCGVVDVCCL